VTKDGKNCDICVCTILQ